VATPVLHTPYPVVGIAAMVTLFAPLLLYLFRSTGTNELSRRWLRAVAANCAVLVSSGWAIAAFKRYSRESFDLAIATTVPGIQLLVLLCAFHLFKRSVGRPPAQLRSQDRTQSNADTLMHGFVLFVVFMAGAFVSGSFVSR
jgi:cytochrome b561